MTAFEAQPSLESQKMSALKIDLKNVPTDSPEAFNDALVANIELAVKGFVDYLNANREEAIGKHFLFRFLKDMPDPKSAEVKLRVELNAQVDEFISDLQTYSGPLLEVLRANRQKPIEKQRAVALTAFNLFSYKMAGYKGVMQSFIPFKLEGGYDAIRQHIEVPLLGFDIDHPTYKPASRQVEADPEQDNADRIFLAELDNL